MRLLLNCALLCASSTAAAQTTWHVDVNGSEPGAGTLADPYTSIQYAIDQTTTLDGDILLVAPGTYVGKIAFYGKTIRVRSSAGPSVTVIDAAQAGSAVTINGGQPATLLEGFTLTGGAYFVGGGLWIQSASPTIRDCVIRGNTAGAKGGGIWIAYGSPVLERCVVAGNSVSSTTGQGGGMYTMYGFTMAVTNCTVALNNAAVAGGIKSEFSTGATLKNCIAWGNAGADLELYQSTLAVSYSDIEGGFAGTGNLDADPQFVAALAGDFHLLSGSPCIDAGDPASPLDPDGSRADIGAYAFGGCGGVASYCTAGTTSNGCVASLSAVGTPSASAGSGFVITAAQVEGLKPGLLFYGVSGRLTQAWGTGSSLLCVKPPTQRTAPQSSGGNLNACDGALALDWNAFIAANPTALGNPFQGGETACVQAWFRDPPAPKTTNLSDALEFVVCPR